MTMDRAVKTLTVLLALPFLAGGCGATSGKSAAQTVDDATITATVKSRLAADTASPVTRVDVDTNNGAVYLSGDVETAEQKTRAEDLARQADGVKAVVNDLHVQKR
jgi:hyperosmotically inducible protein